MARLSLRLLGPFQVTLDDNLLTDFESDKEPALLAYLAAEPDRPHRRETLAELLWPDRAEGAARTNLRHTLAMLRQAIGDRERADTRVRPYLLVDRETVQFNRTSDAWVDVLEFESMLRVAGCESRVTGGGLQATRGQEEPDEIRHLQPETHNSKLKTCVSLYRGPFLEGLSLPDSAAYEEWVLVMRERWQRQAMEALQRLSVHYVRRGEYERALMHARRQVELEPWQEEAQRALMRLLAVSGQRSAALRQYAECERALKEELDVAPAQETFRLYQQIRDGEIRDHRDLTGLQNRTGLMNLPVPVTSFVGRERELNDLGSLLVDPMVRLTTVVGAGGMGKTRLALEAARAALERYPAGVWLVELAPVVDDASVGRAVAAALGVREQPDRSLAETIAGALQHRGLLLVIDNCEHVLDGAAPLVSLLLARCPQLTVLTTTREPLRVPGEHLYETPPLALPDLNGPAERLYDADAVQLFCQCAAEVRPGFALDASSAPLAAEICRRLDGMPLAIELAAARLRALSLTDLARRLDDRFHLLTGGSRTALPRQQTLRNAVEWSYDLLSEGERLVFDRLSVFAGSCSLEGAEAVCSGDGVHKEEVLDLLTGLVDKSLVTRVEAADGTTRYRLLETLRAYGQERLGERGARATFAARHAWFYVSLAEAAEPVLWVNEENTISLLWRLDAEADNLAAAMRWSLARKQLEMAMRLGGALLQWVYERMQLLGQYAEWLHQALVLGEQIAPLYQAKAWSVVALYALNWGRNDEGAVAAQAILDLARSAGDTWWMAWGLETMGIAATNAGDLARAWAHFEESLELARQCGDRYLIITQLAYLSDYERPAGRRALLEELLAQAAYCQRSWLLARLGWTAWALGDLEGAQAHFQAAVSGWAERDEPACRGTVGIGLARIPGRRGDDASAEQVLERSQDLFRQIGSFNLLLWATREMGHLSWRQGDDEKATHRFQECLDLAHEHRYSQETGLARIGLALVACEQSEYDQAEALCEQARPDLPDWDNEAQAFAWCAQGRIALCRCQAASAGQHHPAAPDADRRLTTGGEYAVGYNRPSPDRRLASVDGQRSSVGSMTGDRNAARALDCYRGALDRLRASESRPDICEAIEFLGWALATEEQCAAAARLLASAERERQEMGMVLPPIDHPHHESAMDAVRAALGEQEFAIAWAEGQAMDMEGAIALALPEGEEPDRCG